VNTMDSRTLGLPQQDTVADVNLNNKTVVIGTVNVGRAVRRPSADRVHVDPAANISVTMSAEGLVNRRRAPKGAVVMMNSHPAPVTEFGTMRVQVQDAKTGRWKRLEVKNVAVCPSSEFILLAWSAHAKDIESHARLVFTRTHVHLPLGGGESVWGRLDGGLYSVRMRASHTHTHPASMHAGERQHGERHKAMVAKAESKQKLKEEESMVQSTEVQEGEVKVEQEPKKETVRLSRQQERELELEQEAAMVRMKAKEKMLEVHQRVGHVAKVGAIQAMARRGTLVVTNKRVQKEMMKLKARELGCGPCDVATINKQHPSNSKSALRKGQWTMDGTGKYWTSIHGNRYALVVVAPEGRGLFVEFTKRKKQFPGVFRRKRRVCRKLEC